MKKTIFALVLAIITFTFVFANDVIKVLRVYSNGQCTTIPLAGVDSLKHSEYDIEGKLHSEYVSSIIYAIDSNYQMQIDNIDSIVISEINLQQYEKQSDEIQNLIDEQTDLEINAFQTNLLEELNAKEDIQEVVINESKDFITIKYKNGLEFFIDFQDISFFNNPDENVNAKLNTLRTSEYTELFPYFDVSSEQGEVIIDKNKVLYIQGHDFSKEVEETTDEKEFNRLNNEISSSPLNLEVKSIPHSLLFLDESFLDYGLILIAQTHGAGNAMGAFMVDDISATPETEYNNMYWENMCVNRRALQIYTTYNNKNERLIIKKKSQPVFWITPSLIARKLKGSKSIVFGNYCYSYGLSGHISNTFLGYLAKSNYYKNTEYLIYYIYNLMLGKTHEQSVRQVRDVLGDYFFIASQDFSFVQGSLSSNRQSKERFFSISTDEITQTGANGLPIISGKINGYNNLKKDDLTYLIYCHEGDGEFSPLTAQEDECVILKIPGRDDVSDFKIDEDGRFSVEYPGFFKSQTKYKLIFAFEYNDNIFYGETMNLVPEEKDETITGGELVDLGLSVKWASCNLGAEAPNQLGTSIYINFIGTAFDKNRELFNEDGTKADFCKTKYDNAYENSAGRLRMPTYEELKELKEKCTWELCVVDGVAGARIVGPNKNSIFLPASTDKQEQDYLGDLYMLSRTVYTSGTYDRDLGWSPMALYIYGTYMPQIAMASFLEVEFTNDYYAYIRPVGE